MYRIAREIERNKKVIAQVFEPFGFVLSADKRTIEYKPCDELTIFISMSKTDQKEGYNMYDVYIDCETGYLISNELDILTRLYHLGLLDYYD